MARLIDYTSWADAQKHYSSPKLWELFDGYQKAFNIADVCIDRHAADDPDRIAVIVVGAKGGEEPISFKQLSSLSNKFANFLVAQGIEPGDRVAIMLEPSLAFYAAIFGAIKTGAIAVPLFTLFGHDGIRLRVDDCRPRILVTNPEKASASEGIAGVQVVIADQSFIDKLQAFPDSFEISTAADDYAIFQYTSGTTRELPAAVKHKHRSLVTLMLAALYGTGIRPGDRFFCPSSPAWGHGLWHGTLAPLALGVTTGTFAGRFDAVRLMKALQDYKITNISAAATHYRMMKNSGHAKELHFSIQKLPPTGEPIH